MGNDVAQLNRCVLAAVLGVLLAACSAAGSVHAEQTAPAEPAAQAEAPESEAAVPPSPARPALGLDNLLRPRGVYRAPEPAEVETLGGRSREEWEEAFVGAEEEVKTLEGRVSSLQDQIREASSGGDWGYSPIGAAATSDPEVLRLRSELKRDRRSLETARARLRDLDVEASLAGVPDDWRSPPAPSE